MQLNREKVKSILEYFLIFIIFFVGLRKGGYYKEDSLVLVYIIQLVALLHLIFTEKIKLNYIVGISLISLTTSYFLPIVFNNTASLSGALNMALKIYSLFLVYLVVLNSKSKEKYIKAIVYITLIFGILALDEISYRVFEAPLNFLGGGYVEDTTYRVSSVLQYANILGLLCLLSIICIVFKLDKNKSGKLKKAILNTLFLFFTTIILLTESKMILLLYVGFMLYNIISTKKVVKLIIFICNLILGFLIVALFKETNAVMAIPIFLFYTLYLLLLFNIKTKRNKILFCTVFLVVAIAFFAIFFDYILNIGMISSIKDYFLNFNSTKLRMIYYEDAIRLITSSPLNFIFGLGGNAFRTLYETVQSVEYISLETHSLFMQVFLESGILGLISTIVLVVYLLIKSSSNYKKIMFLITVIFSCFDVFLTYTFMIYVLAILIALCDANSKEINLKFKVTNGILYLIVFIISTLQVIAIFIEPVEVNNLNVTLQEQEKIIQKCELSLKFDPFDIDYIRNCNVAYVSYLELLEIKEELYGYDYTTLKYETVNKIYDNVKKETLYEKSNKYALEDRIYYTNYYIEELVFSNYSDDIKKGYEIYLSQMYNLLEKLAEEHSKNEYAIKAYSILGNSICDNYSYINLTINSDEIYNILNSIKENINIRL